MACRAGWSAAAALAIAAGMAGRHLVRRSLPRACGSLVAPGLEGPVLIRRDRSGTPQVRAGSMADAAFGMGFVHAQDRLWQMDFNRRVAAGRVSELVGRSGVAADRFVRRVGLHRLAAAEALSLSVEGRLMLEAYAAGINAVIGAQHPLPLEFTLTRTVPEAWEPVHSLAIAKLLALGLSANWDNELQRLELLRALGPDRAARLELLEMPVAASLAPALAVPAQPVSVRSQFEEAARWFPTRGGVSNAWVVSGAWTETGRPLLCNDPHLPPGAPGLWYAAHVRAGDDFETTGASIPGMPFPVIGHNRYCAWGCTNSFADAQDLVIEQFEDASGRRYRTERGYVESALIREVIRVRGSRAEEESVLITRHGPVVHPVEQAVDGRWLGLALQWTANTPARTAEAVLNLQRARDWDSFRAAFAGLDAPAQNVLYADVHGHIGYLLSGRVPVRRREPSSLPVPGWTGDALWARFLTMDEVPQRLDPPEGLIVSANNRMVGDDFPHYVARDYMNSYRADRVRELLEARGRGRLSAADMRSIQLDLVCPPARRVVELLGRDGGGGGPSGGARERLAAWDGVMDAGRSEPTAYQAFMRRLAENALTPLCGGDWGRAAGVTLSHALFGYPGNLVGRLAPLLIDHWSRDDQSLFEDTTSWAEVVDRSLAEVTEVELRQPWGRVHAMPLAHRPLGAVPLLGSLLGAGSVEVGGDGDTVLATSFSPRTPYRTTLFAPSWRQIIDVGDWEASTAIHLPGQSGQLGSPHRRDLVQRWLRNEQLPLLWGEPDPAEVEAALTLLPGAAAGPARSRQRAEAPR